MGDTLTHRIATRTATAPAPSHEERQLMIAANTPLLQLAMSREEGAYAAVRYEIGFQWAALGIIASALAYMRTHAEWAVFMKYGAVVGMVAVVGGMSYVWYMRSRMREYHRQGFEIEEGLARITTLFARNYWEPREQWSWKSRQVDAFHFTLFLGWTLYFLYRYEPTSAWISSFFW